MKKIATIMILCLFGVYSNVSACAPNENGTDYSHYPNKYQTTLGTLTQLSNTAKVYLDTCVNPHIAYSGSYYWTNCKITNGFAYPESATLIPPSYISCTNYYTGTCAPRTAISSCSKATSNDCENYYDQSYEQSGNITTFCGWGSYCSNSGGYCQ